MRPQRLVNALFGLALAAGSAQSTTITTFNDVSVWTQASNGAVITEEDFSNPAHTPGLSMTSDVGAINHGAWTDIVSSGTSARNRQVWETTLVFSSPTTGFGGIWDLRPAGYGTGIKITLFAGTEALGWTEIDGLKGDFWGLLSDTAFDRAVLSAGSQRGAKETYRLDDLRLASGSPGNLSAVPIPAAAWLFVSGLFGLIGISRSPRRSRTAPMANTC